jgi:Ni,Fe-hydrogenase III small subunit
MVLIPSDAHQNSKKHVLTGTSVGCAIEVVQCKRPGCETEWVSVVQVSEESETDILVSSVLSSIYWARKRPQELDV